MATNTSTAVPNQTAAGVCDCCERKVSYLRGSAWHGDARICLACFYVWYDPPGSCSNEEAISPSWIKATVLAAEAAGTYPFGWRDQKFRRVA